MESALFFQSLKKCLADSNIIIITDGKPGNIDKVCKDSILSVTVINANKTNQIFGDSGADEVVVIATKE